jgi:integrase
LLKLLQTLPANDVLVPLTAIAAYTGMRLEEIADDTKLSSVTKDYVRIGESKTGAAVRYVPVHKAIRPLRTRLIKSSKDEYLLPGLLRSGADNKRGKLVGKRFGRVIRKLGFDDSTLTFHTLRNVFMTRCEAASVPESTTKLLVGHARPGAYLWSLQSRHRVQRPGCSRQASLIRQGGHPRGMHRP